MRPYPAYKRLAIALASFIVLASARSLVPGLCATQAAFDARCEADQSPKAHSCCSALPSSSGTGGPAVAPLVDVPDIACAFCAIAKSRVVGSYTLDAAPQGLPQYTWAAWPATAVYSASPSSSNAVRAPPIA